MRRNTFSRLSPSLREVWNLTRHPNWHSKGQSKDGNNIWSTVQYMYVYYQTFNRRSWLSDYHKPQTRPNQIEFNRSINDIILSHLSWKFHSLGYYITSAVFAAYIGELGIGHFLRFNRRFFERSHDSIAMSNKIRISTFKIHFRYIFPILIINPNPIN